MAWGCCCRKGNCGCSLYGCVYPLALAVTAIPFIYEHPDGYGVVCFILGELIGYKYLKYVFHRERKYVYQCHVPAYGENVVTRLAQFYTVMHPGIHQMVVQYLLVFPLIAYGLGLYFRTAAVIGIFCLYQLQHQVPALDTPRHLSDWVRRYHETPPSGIRKPETPHTYHEPTDYTRTWMPKIESGHTYWMDNHNNHFNNPYSGGRHNDRNDAFPSSSSYYPAQYREGGEVSSPAFPPPASFNTYPSADSRKIGGRGRDTENETPLRPASTPLPPPPPSSSSSLWQGKYNGVNDPTYMKHPTKETGQPPFPPPRSPQSAPYEYGANYARGPYRTNSPRQHYSDNDVDTSTEEGDYSVEEEDTDDEQEEGDYYCGGEQTRYHSHGDDQAIAPPSLSPFPAPVKMPQTWYY